MMFLLGKLYEEISDKLYEMKVNKATEYELLKNTYSFPNKNFIIIPPKVHYLYNLLLHLF